MPSRLLLLAITSLLLTSCGGAGSTASGGEGDGAATDPAGSWVLVAAQPAIDVPDGVRVTMQVVADDGAWQVSGTAACNSYGGTVVTDDHRWRGQGYGATEMACEEPRMSIERAYLDALETVDTWERPSADELVLAGGDIELRFEALAPVPTAELTATTWVLDGLMAGAGPDAGVSSTVAGADEATLRLAADGTMQASTGCRTFSGEWIETGDEILLTTFGERDDSPNVAADGTTTCDQAVISQENHVLSVLGDGFSAEVDGRRVTLTSRDGLGLSYRAAEG